MDELFSLGDLLEAELRRQRGRPLSAKHRRALEAQRKFEEDQKFDAQDLRDAASVRKQCSNCRFWSGMVAHAGGGDPLMALCLSQKSPNKGRETMGGASCSGWKSGHHGAVDAPPNYGELIRPLYEAEEGPSAALY